MRPSAQLGRDGEDLAAAHLTAAGMQLLDRNWRGVSGELDIVARDGDTVVFVEVKARSGVDFGWPAEAVGPRKARRIRGLACEWLRQNRVGGRPELRFDVVSVVRRPGEGAQLEHLRAAF